VFVYVVVKLRSFFRRCIMGRIITVQGSQIIEPTPEPEEGAPGLTTEQARTFVERRLSAMRAGGATTQMRRDLLAAAETAIAVGELALASCVLSLVAARDVEAEVVLAVYLRDLLVDMGQAGVYEQRCRECGCTERRACVGGCEWVEHDICSACVEKMFREPAQCHQS
jgi:hypothetical protein